MNNFLDLVLNLLSFIRIHEDHLNCSKLSVDINNEKYSKKLQTIYFSKLQQVKEKPISLLRKL